MLTEANSQRCLYAKPSRVSLAENNDLSAALLDEAAAAVTTNVVPRAANYRRRRRRITDAYGKKTIGQIGSFIYIVNQIFGAGILALPLVVKMSGWLPSLLANILVCIVAMFGTLMMMRSMTMIAGNQNFQRRMEYISTVEYYLGRRIRIWTEICFYLSIQSLNVVSIAVVSQSFDHLLIKTLGHTNTLILQLKKNHSLFSFRSFNSQEAIDTIYAGTESLTFGVSYGYIINALICIPLSSQTMNENMKIQYISFLFLITSILQLSISAGLKIYRTSDLNKLPPKAFGYYQYGQLLSTFIASYSYVNVIPSLANEMTLDVKIEQAVYGSSIFSAIIYYIFGYLLAYAYPSINSDNVLREVLNDVSTSTLTKFCIYIFNLLTVLPGILIYSITTRYNLLNSGTASPRDSFIIGCILPFIFAWMLSNDAYFSAVLQWSSLLFSLAVNFIIPSIVYTVACGTQRLATRNPTRHLMTLHSYASRTRSGVQEMMRDVSGKLRAYLYTLPKDELDPYLLKLLESPSNDKQLINKDLIKFKNDMSQTTDASESKFNSNEFIEEKNRLKKNVHFENILEPINLNNSVIPILKSSQINDKCIKSFKSMPIQNDSEIPNYSTSKTEGSLYFAIETFEQQLEALDDLESKIQNSKIKIYNNSINEPSVTTLLKGSFGTPTITVTSSESIYPALTDVSTNPLLRLASFESPLQKSTITSPSLDDQILLDEDNPKIKNITEKNIIDNNNLLSPKINNNSSQFYENEDNDLFKKLNELNTNEEYLRHNNRRHFSRKLLTPPPVAMQELPIEPPRDLFIGSIEGAEDAYECDEEPSTGDLKPIRIHVFPKGPLRTHHILTIRILMCILVAFCVISAGSQIIVDILEAFEIIKIPQN